MSKVVTLRYWRRSSRFATLVFLLGVMTMAAPAIAPAALADEAPSSAEPAPPSPEPSVPPPSPEPSPSPSPSAEPAPSTSPEPSASPQPAEAPAAQSAEVASSESAVGVCDVCDRLQPLLAELLGEPPTIEVPRIEEILAEVLDPPGTIEVPRIEEVIAELLGETPTIEPPYELIAQLIGFVEGCVNGGNPTCDGAAQLVIDAARGGTTCASDFLRGLGDGGGSTMAAAADATIDCYPTGALVGGAAQAANQCAMDFSRGLNDGGDTTATSSATVDCYPLGYLVGSSVDSTADCAQDFARGLLDGGALSMARNTCYGAGSGIRDAAELGLQKVYDCVNNRPSCPVYRSPSPTPTVTISPRPTVSPSPLPSINPSPRPSPAITVPATVTDPEKVRIATQDFALAVADFTAREAAADTAFAIPCFCVTRKWVMFAKNSEPTHGSTIQAELHDNITVRTMATFPGKGSVKVAGVIAVAWLGLDPYNVDKVEMINELSANFLYGDVTVEVGVPPRVSVNPADSATDSTPYSLLNAWYLRHEFPPITLDGYMPFSVDHEVQGNFYFGGDIQGVKADASQSFV